MIEEVDYTDGLVHYILLRGRHLLRNPLLANL